MRLYATILILWSASGSALAQDDAPHEYELAVDRAVEAFQAGRWADALHAFSEAQNVYPNARALRGVGMAAFELGDYVKAARALEGALHATTRRLTESQRQHAQTLLERCFPHVGRVNLAAHPPGGTLWLDGEPIEVDGWPQAPGRFFVSPGSHVVELRGHSAPTLRTELRVEAGTQSAFEPRQVPPNAAAAPENAAALGQSPANADHATDREPHHHETGASSNTTNDEPGDPHESTDARSQKSGSGTAGWVVLGAGAAITIVGAGLLGRGAADANAVRNAEPGTEWSSLMDQFERGPTFLRAGWALAGIGLVTGLVGLVIGLTKSRATESNTRVSLSASGLEVTW